MEALNRKATRIFQHLIDKMEYLELGDQKVVGNKEGVYQCLHIHKLYFVEKLPGTVYSFAHTSTLNGDLMNDPEVCFLASEVGVILPMTYRNDYNGIDHEYIRLEGNQIKIKTTLQAKLTEFANDWMLNLQLQQNLSI